MENGTATLQGPLLLQTQLELVVPTTVAGTLYGIAFTLFCLYVHSLGPLLWDGDRKRRARFMLGYSSIIMLCGLYKLVSYAWVIQDAYIKHENYPNGPYIYKMTTLRTPLLIIMYMCHWIIDASTTAIQIWRVWVVWSATRYANVVIVPPLLCFLTFTGLQLRSNIIDATLPIAKVLQQDSKTKITQTALEAAITLLCTTLISLYLVFEHRRQRKLIGKAQGSAGYMNIVAMLIESYALLSIWQLVSASIWTEGVTVFFTESVRYIEILAYLLVQYRVARGKAYGSQRGDPDISSLHWEHSAHTRTQFGETSEIGGGPRHEVSAEPEACDTSKSPKSITTV